MKTSFSVNLPRKVDHGRTNSSKPAQQSGVGSSRSSYQARACPQQMLFQKSCPASLQPGRCLCSTGYSSRPCGFRRIRNCYSGERQTHRISYTSRHPFAAVRLKTRDPYPFHRRVRPHQSGIHPHPRHGNAHHREIRRRGIRRPRANHRHHGNHRRRDCLPRDVDRTQGTPRKR